MSDAAFIPAIGDVASLRKIGDGREAEIFAVDDTTVLRLFRGGRAAATLDAEIAAMVAARRVMRSVPEVRGRVEVEGRPGILMERVDGKDALSLIASKPWRVWELGAMTGRVQATLHQTPAPSEVPTLAQRYERLRDRILAAVPEHLREFADATTRAVPEGDRLLHGDLHPANVLVSPRGPVVIDWPNAAAGDPHADIARTLLMLRVGEPPPGSPLIIRSGAKVLRRVLIAAYRRGYRSVRPFEQAQVERWYTARVVDRLQEAIPGERDALLAVLERRSRGDGT